MLVRACLATSLDGKISDGLSTTPNFTSREDRARLFNLRSVSDVLLVGAQTVRHESLAPLIRNPKLVEQRRQRRQNDHPDVAIFTRTGELPWQNAYFQAAKQKISIFSPGPLSDSNARQAQELDIQLFTYGDTMNVAFDQLRALRYKNVLCEGGGSLIHSLLAERLVDELHLTIAPTVIGQGDSVCLVRGPLLDPRPEFRLKSVNQVGDELHLVYSLS